MKYEKAFQIFFGNFYTNHSLIFWVIAKYEIRKDFK